VDTDASSSPVASIWSREHGEEDAMGSIMVHEFVTLDGVMDAPTWTFDYGWDPRMGDALAKVTDACNAILLGRRTYEAFEPAWSERTVEDDPGAPFFNDTMKYVVSSTLENATWRNSTILGPYDPARIQALKEEVDGGIYISGSATLLHALLADGLVDELHLCQYPLTRGTTPRLFVDGAAESKWTLGAVEGYDNGVVYLKYAKT
jgi:dihydrofolate reductase